MSLTVQPEQRGNVVVVSVAGELDMATAPQLQDQISDLLEKGRTRLVFDLAEVSFCDSTGLSVFVRAKNHCDAAGGVVRLAAPQRAVLRILEVSGLVEVLRTYPTVEDAISADSSGDEPAPDGAQRAVSAD
jgi:anti-sigma B factor antagonist